MTRQRRLACGFVREQLPLFVGDDLAPPIASGVREHLRGCPACRVEASGHLQALRGLRVAAAVVLPAVDEAFFVRQQETILRAIEAEEPVRTLPSRPRRQLPMVITAAAVLFALGVFCASRPGAAAGLVGRAPITTHGQASPAATSPRTGRELQPLSHQLVVPELPGNDESDSPPVGWMGRLDLRTLENEDLLPLWHPTRSPGSDPGKAGRRRRELLPDPSSASVPDDSKPRRR